MTAGGSSIPEVRRLLAVLALGKRVAEAGTGFGEGAAALAATAASVVTCEVDPQRHAVSAERLAGLVNVTLLEGDWRDLLPSLGPFDLFFLDGGDFKQRPERNGPLAVDLVRRGGLLVVDDFTPGLPGPDPARAFLLEHPQLAATELLTTPDAAAIVAARRL